MNKIAYNNHEVVIIDDYPKHLSLKNDLLEFLENHHDVQNRETNVKSTMTDWTINKYSPPVDDLKKFIISFIQNYWFPFNGSISLNVYNFWGNIYRRGDYTIPHDHEPFNYSVVYFLKSKPNFSPLIIGDFNDNKPLIVKPLEGRIVFFLGSLKHSVPVHIDDETRITLAANVEIK